MLEKIDLNKKLTSQEYNKELDPLQMQLMALEHELVCQTTLFNCCV